MYNILIVDDEFLARNMLHFLLKWEQYDFHIQGEASSASEAIQFLETHENIDVVFTDVDMPGMNGIELAHYIQKTYCDISVVIFSNYSDFDYVKGAFSANVIDYLLKHTITESSLLETLQIIKNKRTGLTVHNNIMSAIEQEQNYRSKIRQAVLFGEGDRLPLHAAIAVMKIRNQQLNMQSYSPQEQNMLFRNFENIIAQIVTNFKNSVILNENESIILYLPFSAKNTQTDIMQLISYHIRQINSAIYKFYNFDLLWGISTLSTPEYTIYDCYLEACSMLNQCPSESKAASFTSENSPLSKLSIRLEKRLLGSISDLNIDTTNQCLEDIFEGITTHEKIDLLINDLTSIACKFYSEFGIASTEFPPLPANSLIPSRYLSWAKELFRHIIETRINMETEHYQSNYARKAIAYMEANYSDPNLALRSIANHVGISEQHLSNVFKKETGTNISAFLSKYRIEKAKELLQKKTTHLKYIYSLVGFNDNAYFYTVFKKHENCTPKEYQEKYSKKDYNH